MGGLQKRPRLTELYDLNRSGAGSLGDSRMRMVANANLDADEYRQYGYR